MPIQKKKTNAAVPLPHLWAKLLSLAQTKEDLICFLSNDLMQQAVPQGCEPVVGGGFTSLTNAPSTTRGDVVTLSCKQEGSGHPADFPCD